MAEDVVDRHGALGGGGVGQHHLAGHIAHGPEVGQGLAAHQHPHLVVDRDEAALGLDPQRRQVQLGAGRHPAGGHQHRIHLQGLHQLLGAHVGQLDRHRAAGRHLAGQQAGAGVDVAAVDQLAGGQLGDVGIEGGHHPIQGLDHRDLAAQGRVHIGKFQADVAAADDRQPAGQPLQAHRLVAGKHGAAVGLDAAGHKRLGAGGNDHVAGGIGALHAAAALPHRYPLVSRQAPLAQQNGRAGPLEGLGEVGADRRHQLVGVVGDLLALEAHRCGMDAEAGQVLGIGQLPHPAAGGQQGLGGHTAPVDAGAAQVTGFDDGDP